MERKYLSATGIFNVLYQQFKKLPDHRKNQANIKISIEDANASILAMFSLKNLFNIQIAPSDTQARTILDEIPTSKYLPIFKHLFGVAQRGKILENFQFLPDESYLLALDGTNIKLNQENVHAIMRDGRPDSPGLLPTIPKSAHSSAAKSKVVGGYHSLRQLTQR